MLAELRRSNEEYFLVTMPLLIELSDPRIRRLNFVNSSCPLSAIKRCSRMSSGDDLFLSQADRVKCGATEQFKGWIDQ
jgi:hypothetical protein